MRSDMLRGATNGSIVPVPKSLNRLAEIAQEVPSIGDLDSTRGTLTDAFGVGTRTIAGDDLDTGPTTQLGSDGGGLTIGQEIDHVVRLEVHQHRAVPTAPPPCPVVDAKDTRRWRDLRTSTSRSKTQQGIWARWNRDTHSQARPSFAAERKTEGVLEISQPPGSTARKGGNFREALGERPTGATPIQTVEPPRGDADGHRPTLPRQIVQ